MKPTEYFYTMRKKRRLASREEKRKYVFRLSEENGRNRMSEKIHPSTDTSDREISTVRIFEAPRELVWQAWVKPEHVIHWWGPNGFTNTIEAMEVRAGGIWKFVMHGPDGVDYPNRIAYIEVIEPEKLVYAHGSDDSDQPGDFLVTVIFKDLDGKTELSMKAVFKTKEARDEVVDKYGAIEGMQQTLNHLGDYLAKMR